MRRLLQLAAGLVICFPLARTACADEPAVSSRPVHKNNSGPDRPYGLKQRVPWTTSRITGSPDPPPPYQLQRLFPNLQFNQPVVITDAPGSDRLFVMELEGKIYSFPNKPDVQRPDLLVDLAEHIEGFQQDYGLTFHPDFARNRYCYICYVMKPELPDGTVVCRFTVTKTDPPRIDPDSKTVVLTWLSGGHNGGCLKFGPDGYLYVSTGDGTGPFPPDAHRAGQDVSNLLSAVLRIDVDHPGLDQPYSIPRDNPFVNRPGARGEIWAYGFRNPWKMNFDSATGQLWVGDVGWELWEMVYRVEKGGNYGWSITEGPQSVHPEWERGPTPILPPAAAHPHTEARSVTGGFVYRGKRLTKLVGKYIYGDYVTGKIWSLQPNEPDNVVRSLRERNLNSRSELTTFTEPVELVDTNIQVICFGVDHTQELYVMGYGGTIHRLIPSPHTPLPRGEGPGVRGGPNTAFPRRLSETGLFTSMKEHKVAPGVIPYSINAEPWADFAVAQRFVALPGVSTIGVHKQNDPQRSIIKGNWKFPPDAVLMKTISLPTERNAVTGSQPPFSGGAPPRPPAEGRPLNGKPGPTLRRLETQIFHLDGDTWRPYTYIWNDEQTDAILADDAGRDRTFTVIDPQAPGGKREQTWHFASRTECLMCHSSRGGVIYGFVPQQLNGPHNYGGIVDNQLRAMSHIGLFEEPPRDADRFSNPYDPSADVITRARAYLHVNCMHCHQRGGGGTAVFELEYDKPLKRTYLLGSKPTQGTFGIHDAYILAPGDPYRSVLYYRMAKRGPGRMPYFGSNLVDPRGLRLMHDWIAQLPPTLMPLPSPSGAGVGGDGLELAGGNGDDTLTRLRNRQRKLLADLCAAKSTDADRMGATVDQLLATVSGALMVLQAVDDGRLSPSVQQQVVDRAAVHAELSVRDLFERFLPAEKRIQRLGTAVKPEQLLALNGNPDDGRRLFFETNGVQCRNCHKINGQGNELGPDLSEVGKKYSRAELLENILEPSKKIDPKFLTYLVETAGGRVHSGLLVERTDEQVVLKDNERKLIRIPADQVEVFVPQRKSLMPELLVRDMTAQQVADLLAYLDSLK